MTTSLRTLLAEAHSLFYIALTHEVLSSTPYNQLQGNTVLIIKSKSTGIIICTTTHNVTVLRSSAILKTYFSLSQMEAKSNQ